MERMESECENCEYYDHDENVCTACDCWPVMDCDTPLPCEKEK